MKDWEDIIKDKLEGYPSSLPEGSLEEFRARRDAARREVPAAAGAPESAPAPKHRRLLLAIPTGVAAGLAAFLLLRQPEGQGDVPQNGNMPDVSVAVAAEPDTTAEKQQTPLIAQADVPTAAGQSSAGGPGAMPWQETNTGSGSEDSSNTATGETEVPEQNPQTSPASQSETSGPVREDDVRQDSSNPENTSTVPYIPAFPEISVSKTAGMNVGPAMGIVAGGGLLAAAIQPTITLIKDALRPEPEGTGSIREAHGAWHDYPQNPDGPEQPGVSEPDPGEPDPIAPEPAPVTPPKKPSPIGGKHNIPVKIGLTARIPVSDRLNMVTGLEYSRYSSEITYSFGTQASQTQLAHYLGIPVRLDWTLASGKKLDVYLGAGVEADYCLGVQWNKYAEQKDGLSLSLLGAGGVQFNMTRRTGFYIEPQLSWTLPSQSRVLKTYRSEHPLMFSMAAGLRITLGKE